MAGKTTKVYREVKQCWQSVLNGRLLSIDPSTGSGSSMPGYAVFYKGQLEESDIIQVNPADRRNQKLFSISESLYNEFDEPDVLAIEHIPPVPFNRKGAMNGWSIAALQRAIGAIISCFNCEYIEVSPKAWQNHKPANYQKTDEWDAITIGLCVIDIARQIQAEIER